ncbi:MAG: hypothetical protein HC871_12775, partial [Rhizobiales bacterium]|nr:hypothetical protein [Hyphomicrobiales bacterium]
MIGRIEIPDAGSTGAPAERAQRSLGESMIWELVFGLILMLAGRRSGYLVMLLVGLFAAAMPVLHMRGARYGDIARSAGGFFFVWTLWALGGLGAVTFVLSARGLWRLRPGQPDVVR